MTRIAICLFMLLLTTAAARAEGDVAEAQLTLADHIFEPQQLTVPANKKIKLTIVNKDATSAEFESDDLKREKIVPASGQIYVYIGPLDAGSYGYFDDFHHSTATGTILAQ